MYWQQTDLALPINAKDFWMVSAGVAATLAGFTLAGYSIYIARAGMVASDSLCRRYSLKDASSEYSWGFIFLVLAMFMAPIILSLSYLTPKFIPHPLTLKWMPIIIKTLLMICMMVVLWACSVTGKQASYVFKGQLYFLKDQSIERKLGDGVQARIEQSRLYKILLLLTSAIMSQALRKIAIFKPGTLKDVTIFEYCTLGSFAKSGLKILIVLLALSLSIIILTSVLALAVLQIIYYQNWHIASPVFVSKAIGAGFSEQLAMLLSASALILGLSLTYWHFHIFHPSLLLFEVDETSRSLLIARMSDLRSKLDSVRRMQARLNEIIDNLDERVLRRVMFERMIKSETDILESSKKLLEGRHYIPELELDQKSNKYKLKEYLLFERQTYHRTWIELCISNRYVPYNSFVRIMAGFELYSEAINSFELKLKTMQIEYQDILRYIDANPFVASRKIRANVRLGSQGNHKNE